MPQQPDPPRAFAVQPDEGEGYWQPLPANGYVEVHISRARHRTVSGLESGIQEIAPGGAVREHEHDAHEELILVMAGEGHAVVAGERHPMRPGTTLYLAPRHRHRFVNEGAGPLRFFWVLLPGGIGDYFRAIGRLRTPGAAPPAPFPRPAELGPEARRARSD